MTSAMICDAARLAICHACLLLMEASVRLVLAQVGGRPAIPPLSVKRAKHR